MSWFEIALILHILGVLVLFGAITMEFVSSLLLRRARAAAQIGDIGAVMRRVGPVFGPAGGVILLSGIYMTAVLMQHHQPVAWVVVSLVLFVAMAASGTITGKKTEEAMKKALSGSRGKLTPELEKLARVNPGQINAAFGPWAIVGLVVLMVLQPNAIASVIVLLVMLAIGFVTYRQLFRPLQGWSAAPKRSAKA